MKYHMHKTERELTDRKDIIEIIRRGQYITLAFYRENEPYLVTMNYGYDEMKNALYFHCAKKGLKLDFIRANPAVCATVVDDRGYLFDKCAHAYTSAVIWGRMTIVNDPVEKRHGADVLITHLEKNPEAVKKRLLKNDSVFGKMDILRLDIRSVTGKKGN